MPDTEKTQAEKNAELIKQEEATTHTPRGNVHSEEESGVADQHAPPPMPH